MDLVHLSRGSLGPSRDCYPKFRPMRPLAFIASSGLSIACDCNREAGNSSTYTGMLALRHAQFQHAVRLPASIAAPATLCCIAHISCLIWRLLRCPEGKLSTDCPVIEGLSQVCPIGVFRGICRLLQLAEGGHC
jgi:hypothetical protein